MAASTEALIAAVAATLPLPSTPPLPLTSYSSPLPQIPSPPLPVSSFPISPLPLPTSPTDAGAPLGYRAAMIQLRVESPYTSYPLPLPPPIVLPHTRASMVLMRAVTPSTYILAPRSGTLPSWTPPSGTPLLLLIPLPTSSPPLLLPSTNCRADVLKVMLPPQKRLCIAPSPRYEIGESSSLPTARPTRGFKITDVWEDPDEIAKEIPAADVAELGQRMTNFVITIRQDTNEICGRLDDARDDRLVMSSQLNFLCRDRSSHARTARLMEGEAKADHEAWAYKLQMTGIARRGNDSAEDIADSDGVADVLVERDATRSRNGKDSHDSGTGVRRTKRAAREMETVFRISNCTVENQIKFATCTLLGSALTWWNSHVRIIGHDVAYAMTSINLKKIMTDKYCPRSKIKKLEVEMMFPEESDKIKRYVSGLPDLMTAVSKWHLAKFTMQDAIEFATELMDKKICTFAER
ncbi:hypothetical protein Tco_0382393 [Tanacetum coccineum]